MANKILVKSKVDAAGTPATGDATVAEMAVNTFDGKLFVGTNIGVDGTTNGTYLAGEDSAQVSWVGAPIDTTTTLGDSNAKLATQGAIKTYVDAAEARAAQGLAVKTNVVAATTANITIASALNDADTLDGVTLADDDRVLVKNQTSAAENGIYVVAASPVRADDMNADGEFANAFVFVTGGSVNADTGWACTVDEATITVGTTDITFAQFNSAGTVTAGTNMTKSGNTLSVDDAFLKNDASDTMAGTLTATGLTTGNSGVVKFMDGDGTHYTTIAAHATTTTSEAYTLPAADGTNGQVLSTNGSGVMSWASAASSDIDVSVANLTARLPQVTESVTIGDATDVTITTAGALTATGVITANGGLTLGAGDDLIGSATSDIAINTDKFTVAGATGNTLVAGTFGVSGVSTLDDITAAADAKTPGANASSTGGFNFTPGGVTEASSGTHALLAGMTVNPLAVTNHANGTTTTMATLHLDGVPTHTGSSFTNTYSLWCGGDDGTTVDGRIGGAIISGGTY